MPHVLLNIHIIELLGVLSTKRM